MIPLRENITFTQKIMSTFYKIFQRREKSFLSNVEKYKRLAPKQKKKRYASVFVIRIGSLKIFLKRNKDCFYSEQQKRMFKLFI